MSFYVGNWHFSDLLTPPTNVGYQGKSGSNSDIAKSTRLPLRIVGMDMQRREFSPAGWRQFRRMEPFCLTADTSLRLICAKPYGQR